MDEEMLLKRLDREKKARVAAENLLEAKSLELYNANQDLREASRKLERKSIEINAILENIRAGILLCDEHGRVRRANRAAELMFGLAAEEFEEREAVSLLQNADAQSLDASSVGGDVAELSAAREDMIGQRSGGETFPLELAIAELEIENRPHTVWICRDISRRKKAAQEKEDLENELAQSQKLESLGVLASGIAHEINTPVQYVTDNVNFLQDASRDLEVVLELYGKLVEQCSKIDSLHGIVEEVKKAEEEADVEFIREEAPEAFSHAADGLVQIAKIVSAIKTFAHPGTEDRTEININEALETTITVCRNQWKYVADLTTDFQEDIPPLPCFPGSLNQVMLNLIVNAAQAIEEAGEERGTIVVKTREIGGAIEVSVSDTGCGIDPEHQGKIFDPFFTTKEVGKGTGQGLSLCYNIVHQKHSGAISFTSEMGTGTTFKVSLPLNAADAEREAA